MAEASLLIALTLSSTCLDKLAVRPSMNNIHLVDKDNFLMVKDVKATFQVVIKSAL